MIVIIDYGLGNLFSLKSAFASIGEQAVISGEKDIIRRADRILLPGVGAFGDAALKLRERALDGLIKEEVSKGKPLLGICLGMQLLFESSEEHGCHTGLGLIEGQIKPIAETVPAHLKIPHIGWNALHFPEDKEKSPIFKYIKEQDCVYFVHSYHAVGCKETVTATTEYGSELTAAVGYHQVYGCQFHPEKSGLTGLNILKAFCEIGD
ncbi:imidazole glycerol phosphate synthase subunit HisH [Aminipila luticellarii]|uniref:Imidazole glycerol phosphate synthase subunit HisH n=1 Tax=Aminipila luticellarii TaxID=2507160 RepID=A0A410PWH8_9FIRM|nr:imidazole glycerol phosphate synthase subunit HisH [Aminipila luticellarii]QAT43236.1 imidazole glycerol phosphate synthase subunit HisH [Aminipila luticellarii]